MSILLIDLEDTIVDSNSGKPLFGTIKEINRMINDNNVTQVMLLSYAIVTEEDLTPEMRYAIDLINFDVKPTPLNWWAQFLFKQEGLVLTIDEICDFFTKAELAMRFSMSIRNEDVFLFDDTVENLLIHFADRSVTLELVNV